MIDLEAVGDPVPVENVMEFDGVEPQAVLIADIDRNRAILPRVVDVLIDERQRRIGGEFGRNSAGRARGSGLPEATGRL